MNSVKILTDSTVQLSKEEQERYHITIVPLAAMLNHTLYYDNITVSNAEFLKLMEEIKKELEFIKKKTKLYIGIVNLDNLIKCGRMSQTLGRISTFLNMKLMLNFPPAALIPETKERGLKTFTKTSRCYY